MNQALLGGGGEAAYASKMMFLARNRSIRTAHSTLIQKPHTLLINQRISLQNQLTLK